MSLMDFFRDKPRPATASVAKERLKVIVAHERQRRNEPDYLAAMQRDILEVVQRYIPVEYDDVNVQIENEGHVSMLELNVTLPGSKDLDTVD